MRKVKHTIVLTTIFLVSGFFLTGCMGNKNDRILSHLNEAKYQKVIAEADKALEGEPEDKKYIVYNRGRAKMHLERYDEAVDDFKQALKINSGDEWAKWPTYRIGQVNMKRGDYKTAITKFSSSLRFDQDWTKALDARAEAKSKLGDEVDAEEDRQLVRKIDQRKARTEKRKKIEEEREELMEHWNNKTAGAPVHNYERPIKGVESITSDRTIWGSSPVHDSSYDECGGFNDSFEKVDQRLSELGGRLVRKKEVGDDYMSDVVAVWEFTWWYASHPNVKFNWHHEYGFYKCDDGTLEVGSEMPFDEWGHAPETYDEWIDYLANEGIFPADGSYPVCKGCE